MTFSVLDFTAIFTCKDTMELFADGGKPRIGQREVEDPHRFRHTRRYQNYCSGSAELSFSFRDTRFLSNGLVTNSSWKCSDRLHRGWNFDDRIWPAAAEIPRHHSDGLEGNLAVIDPTANWIWTTKQKTPSCYCRVNLQ